MPVGAGMEQVSSLKVARMILFPSLEQAEYNKDKAEEE